MGTHGEPAQPGPTGNFIADSGHGMAIMEGSEADVAGDEEVEGRDEGVTAKAAFEAGTANLVWDPRIHCLSLMTRTPASPNLPLLL